MQKLQPGDILNLTRGEYADFSIVGIYKVLRPFNDSDLSAIVQLNALEEHTISDLVQCLKEHGYIMRMPEHSLHLGDYNIAPSLYIAN